jgi:hypothetical protein
MTRAEQNTLILNSITTDLKDKPNVQNIIASKFDAWFKELVKQGQELLMQGQVATSGGGGEAGGAEGGGAAPPEGAPA